MVIACVAGGIVGAQNSVLAAEPLEAIGEAARRMGRTFSRYFEVFLAALRLRHQNFIPRAYNTTSYAGYTGDFSMN